jgi:7-cyano-7-deazaguanine synthase
MCGIAGYFKIRGDKSDYPFMTWFASQLDRIKARGIDAAGIVWIFEDAAGDWHMRRRAMIGNDFDLNVEMEILADWSDDHQHLDMIGDEPHNVIGCVINFRNIPVTESFGGPLPDDQIQPFTYEGLFWDDVSLSWLDRDGIIVAHNGQLSNDRQLCEKHNFPRLAESGDHDIDSYLFLKLWLHTRNSNPRFMFDQIEGSWACSIVDMQSRTLCLSRTFLGLDVVTLDRGANSYIAWGSELDLPVWTESQFERAKLYTMPSYSFDLIDIGYIRANQQVVYKAAPRCPAPLNKNELLPGYINSVAVVASGGLDSTVALAIACRTYPRVHILHFQYGAKAQNPEKQAIHAIHQKLAIDYPHTKITIEIIDLGYLKRLGGSTLTDDALDINHGEHAAESASEWVPARNTILIAMAAAYCDRHDVKAIILGLNREESATHCDNSSEFFQAYAKALDLGTKSRPKMIMPLADLMKHHIVKKGIEIGAPIDLSWSCYKAITTSKAPGVYIRCGQCGSCLLRRRAYAMNGIQDPVPYLADDPTATSIYERAVKSYEKD